MDFKDKITYLDVASKLGIKKGDIVFVSSDIIQLFFYDMRINKIKPDINKFIDSFIECVGEEGTLLFPTYNWDFCRGITFDWANTPGRTGSLGNACLKRKDFKRTNHPMYSCAVWGKDKDYLCSIDYKSSFGEDSIFGYLDKKHAKQVIIGVDLTHCFTYLHYVEEKVPQLDYRYMKDFTSTYIDSSGNKTTRTYSMLVRYLDKEVVADFSGIEKIFLSKGLERKFVYNTVEFIVFNDLHLLVDPILEDTINNHSRNTHKFIGQ